MLKRKRDYREEGQEEGVQTLVLQLHLNKLWDPPIPEEDFVR